MKKLSLRLLLSTFVLSSAMVWAQSAPPSPAAVQMQAADDSGFLLSNEPLPNLGLLKLQLKDYAHCTSAVGCYAKEMQAQADRASVLLDLVVPGAMKGEKLALVLDIDETSLSNMVEMEKEDYGYIAADSHVWETSAQDPALPGTLELYRHAQKLGMDVFFITGRGEEERAATEKNLTAAGYTGWKNVALRTKGQYPTTVAYKSAERAKIIAAGYRLVMNVGDQLSDLEGTSQGEISVKLPNPFYYIP